MVVAQWQRVGSSILLSLIPGNCWHSHPSVLASGTLPGNRTCTAGLVLMTSTILINYHASLVLPRFALPPRTLWHGDQLSAACTYYRQYVEHSTPIIGICANNLLRICTLHVATSHRHTAPILVHCPLAGRPQMYESKHSIHQSLCLH